MPRTAAFACLTAAALFWGASFVLGKAALVQVGPAQLLVLRFGLAALVFLPWALAHRPRGRDLGWFLLAAFLTVPATFGLQFYGLALTSAGHAALLVGLVPAVMALVTWAVLRQPVAPRDWAAAGAAVAGVVVLVAAPGGALSSPGPGPAATLAGDLLVGASTLAIVGWILVQRRLGRSYGPGVLTPWVTVLGAVLLVPLAFTGPFVPLANLTPATWAALGALALFPTVLSYALWNLGARSLAPHQTGIFLAVEPLAGVLLAALVLGEALTWSTALAALLIVGSLVVVAKAPAQSAQ